MIYAISYIYIKLVLHPYQVGLTAKLESWLWYIYNDVSISSSLKETGEGKKNIYWLVIYILFTLDKLNMKN